MTNEQMLDDLKHYIGLETEELEFKIIEELEEYTHKVVSDSTRTKLEAMGTRVEKIEAAVDSHETRITKLETHTTLNL